MATNKLTQINQKNISNGTSNKEAAANTDKKSSGFNKKKLAFSAAAAAAIAALAIGSILMIKKGKSKAVVQDVPSKLQEIIPTSSEPPLDLEAIEKRAGELLENRFLYEQQVISQVGGKTGADMRWDEIVRYAKEEDLPKCLQFAHNYPAKTELIKNYYNKLRGTMSKAQKFIEEYKGKEITEQTRECMHQLELPFEDQDKVEKLIRNGNLLKKRGILYEMNRKGDNFDFNKFRKVFPEYFK